MYSRSMLILHLVPHKHDTLRICYMHIDEQIFVVIEKTPGHIQTPAMSKHMGSAETILAVDPRLAHSISWQAASAASRAACKEGSSRQMPMINRTE